jgi:hypothetical protein
MVSGDESVVNTLAYGKNPIYEEAEVLQSGWVVKGGGLGGSGACRDGGGRH